MYRDVLYINVTQNLKNKITKIIKLILHDNYFETFSIQCGGCRILLHEKKF